MLHLQTRPARRGGGPEAVATAMFQHMAAVVAVGEGSARAPGSAGADPKQDGCPHQRRVHRQTEGPRGPGPRPGAAGAHRGGGRPSRGPRPRGNCQTGKVAKPADAPLPGAGFGPLLLSEYNMRPGPGGHCQTPSFKQF